MANDTIDGKGLVADIIIQTLEIFECALELDGDVAERFRTEHWTAPPTTPSPSKQANKQTDKQTNKQQKGN